MNGDDLAGRLAERGVLTTIVAATFTGDWEVRELDLASLDSVRAFVARS